MTDTATRHHRRPLFAHSLRIFAVPIVLIWIAIAVVLNVVAPQLEVVGELHAAPMAPEDAPSMIAMKRMGANFKEFNSNSTVMVVVEGQQPLGPDAHQYYDEIIRKLKQDPEHIQHIQDFWGDTLTAAGAQSPDGKASYVMLNLAGEQGQTLANEGVQAVRKIIEETKAPPGVQAYVAGPAALTDDLHVIGNASLAQITLITLIAIAGMLLIVYRSIITTLIQLFLTGIGLLTSRGMISTLAMHDVFGLTTFAGNILTMLAIAAATDYGIFIFGRYREARGSGLDRDEAYYTTFRSVAPVIIGSGLTIAAATYCLSFARLPYFSTMGAPVAIGMIVVVASAVTLGPAVLFLGSRVGLFESRRAPRSRFWRRVGVAVVRWPTDFRGELVHRADRHRRATGIQAGLQRSLLPAGQRPCEHRLRRRRPTLHPSSDEPRHRDDRGRSRYAESGRYACPEQGFEQCHAHRRHCDGAEHHQAARHSDPAQLDTLPDECSGPDQQHEPAVPAGSVGQPAQNGRCDEPVDRHRGEAVSTVARADPAHAGLGGQVTGGTRYHRGAAR
jgi:hypothetical protein